MGKLCVVSCVWSVMQCSAAMDILFVMDSSYSVGKGGFERSRHYVLKLYEALNVSKDKVRLHKLRLREKFSQNWKIAIIYLPMCNFNRLCYNYVGLFVVFKLHSLFGQVRVGVIQFGSTPKLEISLDSYKSKEELKKRWRKSTIGTEISVIVCLLGV